MSSSLAHCVDGEGVKCFLCDAEYYLDPTSETCVCKFEQIIFIFKQTMVVTQQM